MILRFTAHSWCMHLWSKTMAGPIASRLSNASGSWKSCSSAPCPHKSSGNGIFHLPPPSPFPYNLGLCCFTLPRAPAAMPHSVVGKFMIISHGAFWKCLFCGQNPCLQCPRAHTSFKEHSWGVSFTPLCMTPRDVWGNLGPPDAPVFSSFSDSQRGTQQQWHNY